MNNNETSDLHWFDDDFVAEGIGKIRSLIEQDSQCVETIQILKLAYYFSMHRQNSEFRSFIDHVTKPLPLYILEALDQNPDEVDWFALMQRKNIEEESS